MFSLILRLERFFGSYKRYCRMNRFVLFYVFCCLLTVGAKAQSVAERLENLVHSSVLLKTSEAGIAVFDLTEGQYLYRYQSGKLSRPASTQKIITSVSALARLGTAYTFDTKLAYTGTVKNDTLNGDLYLVGGAWQVDGRRLFYGFRLLGTGMGMG